MSGRILRFSDCEHDVRVYCDQHGLDFAKAKHMVQCFGPDLLWLQYHDPDKGKDGLYDETRMPVVLQIKRTNAGIAVTETEYTKQYLSA